MSKIIIKNINDRVVETYDSDKTVFNVLQDNFIDWMHACGAKGRCTTCKMIVKNGMDNLSPLTHREEHYASQGALHINERLACQSKIISGSIEIVVPDSSKLPHMEYTDLNS